MSHNQSVDEKKYNDLLTKVQMGTATEKEWTDYCNKLFSQILEDNKDVFIRMKEND